jgi:hypothetical protein
MMHGIPAAWQIRPIVTHGRMPPAMCVSGRMNAAASAWRIASTLAGSVTLSFSAIGTLVCRRSRAASASGSAGIGCSKYSRL